MTRKCLSNVLIYNFKNGVILNDETRHRVGGGVE